ncbi:hypothetical protein NDA16_004214 [Ustilago loliicola]|nr:hypothetical protein NDA16_004214 [Ustilago loliicola]
MRATSLPLNMAKLLALLLVIMPFLLAIEAQSPHSGMPAYHPRMMRQRRVEARSFMSWLTHISSKASDWVFGGVSFPKKDDKLIPKPAVGGVSVLPKMPYPYATGMVPRLASETLTGNGLVGGWMCMHITPPADTGAGASAAGSAVVGGQQADAGGAGAGGAAGGSEGFDGAGAFNGGAGAGAGAFNGGAGAGAGAFNGGAGAGAGAFNGGAGAGAGAFNGGAGAGAGAFNGGAGAGAGAFNGGAGAGAGAFNGGAGAGAGAFNGGAGAGAGAFNGGAGAGAGAFNGGAGAGAGAFNGGAGAGAGGAMMNGGGGMSPDAMNGGGAVGGGAVMNGGMSGAGGAGSGYAPVYNGAGGAQQSAQQGAGSDSVPTGYIRYNGQLMTVDQYQQALASSGSSPNLHRRELYQVDTANIMLNTLLHKRQSPDPSPAAAAKKPAKVLMCINGDPAVAPIKFNTMTGLRIRDASDKQDGVVAITNLPNYQMPWMPFLPTEEMWAEQQTLMLAQEQMIEQNMTTAAPPSP